MATREDLAAPIPFETDTGLRAFLRTLILALDPVQNAARFALGDTQRARRFFMLTFPFWAALAGIAPFTFLVQFGPSGKVTWLTENHLAPAPYDLMVDVARSMVLGILFGVFYFALLAVPFVQLARALSDRGHAAASVRASLYLGWLLPFFQTLQAVVGVWMPPVANTQASAGLAFLSLLSLMTFVPIAMFYWNLRLTARIAHGNGPIASWFVLILAILISQFSSGILEHQIRPWMPSGAIQENTPSRPATSRSPTVATSRPGALWPCS